MKFDRQLRTTTETLSVVSYGGKTIPRWRTAAILKIDISPYLSEKSSDFYDVIKQEALLSQRGRAMLRICIASIQNFERSFLLLVVSASDIPLRTINFFSVLFSSAYSSMLQAVTNKHSLVRRRLCDLHCMVIGNCFCHFVVRTSSNRSIVSGAWPTVSYSQLHHR